jgi:hypothetical protein
MKAFAVDFLLGIASAGTAYAKAPTSSHLAPAMHYEAEPMMA